jgi:hypothetical protein
MSTISQKIVNHNVKGELETTQKTINKIEYSAVSFMVSIIRYMLIINSNSNTNHYTLSTHMLIVL